MEMNELKEAITKKSNDALEKIKQTLENNEAKMKISCHIVSRIFFIGEILMFMAASYGFVAAILIALNKMKQFAVFAGAMSTFAMSVFMPFNDFLRRLDFMTERQLALIFHISLGIFSLMFAFGLHNWFRIFFMISKNTSPFDMAIVKRFQSLSIFSIFCGLIQPVFLIFALLFFAITYIFQYGSVLQRKADNTINDQEKIIFALAEMSENKSGQTGQHIKRVSEYSRILAEGLNLPKFKVAEIRLASVWHDIGKLMIDSSILEKPGKLTDEEFSMMKRHVVFGDELLRGLEGDVFEIARLIARDHHERIDGRGYALGKSNGDISLEGRIVAVADVFDALTSKRSYKDAWRIDDAYEEIVKNSGTQFDAQVVEVFKNKFDEIKEVAEKFREC